MSGRLGLVVVALTLWAGCFLTSQNDAELAPGDDDGLRDGDCFDDSECVLAGASCCECPSFALPASSGWGDACEQVDCPAPGACPALLARCEQGTCVAACAQVECDLSCRQGFAVDAAGCTVCVCGNAPAEPECEVATDCVRVPGDCCGCDRGGSDVAVPAGIANSFVEDLMCTGNEACPGVSTCEAGAQAYCDAGRCALGNSGATPPDDGECGRPDQPPCPAGSVCVINSADAEAGTGHCQAPSP
jgi:hypothetical protein